MNIFELIEKRRSVRKFNDTDVPGHVIKKCLKASVLAANSSNLQPWEFYWIRDDKKKERVIKACFYQNAAKTAKEIVIAVSRIDTWQRNSKLIIKNYKENNTLIPIVKNYYRRLVPFMYYHDYLGITGIIKSLIYLIINIIGLFRPVIRGPIFRHNLFETVTKTTALACQNFMLTLVEEGFDSCPMEGFDEKRIKKILNLNKNSHVVMIFGIGKSEHNGVYGERFRIKEDLVIKEI